jgi:hypothetical protein
MHETGLLTVAPPRLESALPAEAAASDANPLRAAIADTDAHWRTELAGEAPALVADVTVWALTTVYRAAQFLIFREVEPQVIHVALAEPCPRPPAASPPEICYSADLALRVLPDLLKLARAAAPTDPLVEALLGLARQWPLSSVGCGQDIERADIAAFAENPALRMLYADRIIERQDLSRLDDPRVAADVRRALSIFPNLAPKVAAVVTAQPCGRTERSTPTRIESAEVFE